MTIHTTSRNKGFTLIEILVVIAIIASLAGISFPIAKSMMNRSKAKESQLRMQEFEYAINSFNLANNYLPFSGDSYPTGDLELSGAALTDVINLLIEDAKSTKHLNMPEAKSGRNGLTYTASSPQTIVDSWGEEFYVLIDYDLDSKLVQNASSDADKTINGKTVILISKGSDRNLGGGDDVYSWK